MIARRKRTFLLSRLFSANCLLYTIMDSEPSNTISMINSPWDFRACTFWHTRTRRRADDRVPMRRIFYIFVQTNKRSEVNTLEYTMQICEYKRNRVRVYSSVLHAHVYIIHILVVVLFDRLSQRERRMWLDLYCWCRWFDINSIVVFYVRPTKENRVWRCSALIWIRMSHISDECR